MHWLQVTSVLLLIAGGIGCLWSGIRLRRHWSIMLGVSGLLAAAATFAYAFGFNIASAVLFCVGAAFAITAMFRVLAYTRASR